MDSPKKNIVVIGAGYGGITAVLRVARLFRDQSDFQVHLVDRNPFHLLKTQLHEAAVLKTKIAIPIERLIGRRNIIFHLDEVGSIDPDGKIVFLQNGFLPLDFLIVALGSHTDFYGIPGLQEHSFTLETLADALQIHDHIARLCAQASSEPDVEQRRNLLRFVIGGGGLSGVEFAAEFAENAVHCTRNYHVSLDDVEIILVQGGDRIMPNLEESISASVSKKLLGKRVTVLTNTKIVSQTAGTVALSSGLVLETRTLVWTGVSTLRTCSGRAD